MARKTSWVDDQRNCYYCGGAGYVQRIPDRSRIKCLRCDGTGRKKQERADGEGA